MHAFGLLLAAVSGLSSAADNYTITCGQAYSDTQFMRLANSSSRSELAADYAPIERELEKCPNDWFLIRLAFVSYLWNRQCDKANDLLSRIDATTGNGKFTDDDTEHVAFCFYEGGEYAAAAKAFSTMKSVTSGVANTSTLHAYAESLYGNQEIDRAISTLRAVGRKGYKSNEDKLNQLAYLDSLVALARMLHAKGEFAESLAVAHSASEIDADSTEAAEIGLASAARLEGLDSDRLRQVYCRAKDLAANVDAPEVKDDLAKIESRILPKDGNGVDCKP